MGQNHAAEVADTAPPHLPVCDEVYNSKQVWE